MVLVSIGTYFPLRWLILWDDLTRAAGIDIAWPGVGIQVNRYVLLPWEQVTASIVEHFLGHWHWLWDIENVDIDMSNLCGEGVVAMVALKNIRRTLALKRGCYTRRLVSWSPLMSDTSISSFDSVENFNLKWWVPECRLVHLSYWNARTISRWNSSSAGFSAYCQCSIKPR